MSTWPPTFDIYEPLWKDTSEQTPESHAPFSDTPERVEHDTAVGGVFSNCYLCGLSTRNLTPEATFRFVYTKTPTNDERRRHQALSKYLLTYCHNCYFQFVLP